MTFCWLGFSSAIAGDRRFPVARCPRFWRPKTLARRRVRSARLPGAPRRPAGTAGRPAVPAGLARGHHLGCRVRVRAGRAGLRRPRYRRDRHLARACATGGHRRRTGFVPHRRGLGRPAIAPEPDAGRGSGPAGGRGGRRVRTAHQARQDLGTGGRRCADCHRHCLRGAGLYRPCRAGRPGREAAEGKLAADHQQQRLGSRRSGAVRSARSYRRRGMGVRYRLAVLRGQRRLPAGHAVAGPGAGRAAAVFYRTGGGLAGDGLAAPGPGSR